MFASAETNLPPVALNVLVAAIVGFNVLTALNPASPTFSPENQADVRKRPKGPIQNPKINPVSNPQEFLGIDKVLTLFWATLAVAIQNYLCYLHSSNSSI